MGYTDIIIVAVLFGLGAFFCLGWMMWNLISVSKKDGLSSDFKQRGAQTKQILLKPALTFFVIATLASGYFMLRNLWVAS